MADTRDEDDESPDVRVLAIASHVVYGYVGNTMATFVMQALGLDVAAMNTVNFSNHTGYHRFTGPRTPASDLTSLYAGLKAAYLTDFSVLLSGYIPSSESVDAVARIARDLRFKSTTRPGSFFWVLDPVMGDNGKLYVEEGIVGKYRGLVSGGDVDLVLPNQFEVELLAGLENGFVGEKGVEGARVAIGRVHEMGVRHVVVTSIRVKAKKGLVVVGSTVTSQGKARMWKIELSEIGCFFSGTGDMFAGLMVGRLREEAQKQNLLDLRGWISPDEVKAEETPLAKAAEKVLSSMQMVLEKTKRARDKEIEGFGRGPGASVGGVEGDQSGDEQTRRYLAETKAAEVRVVRHWRDLVEPEERYKAVPVEE